MDFFFKVLALQTVYMRGHQRVGATLSALYSTISSHRYKLFASVSML